MEEYLRLKDEFKIDDSHSKIRGFVVCKTEDGKIIFTKENMIVKEGRDIILKKVFQPDSAELRFFAISGSEYKMTSPDDSIKDGASLYKAFGTGEIGSAISSGQFVKVSDESALEETQYCINETDLYAHFKLKKAHGGSGSVTSSFGLAIKVSDSPEAGDTGYRLFSRVTFPSYPDSVNLIFDYYIYF